MMYVQPKENVDRTELGTLLNLIDYVRGRLCLAITQLPSECTDRRRLLELVQEESLLLMENARVVQQWKD
jgi:hypothetical protein